MLDEKETQEINYRCGYANGWLDCASTFFEVMVAFGFNREDAHDLVTEYYHRRLGPWKSTRLNEGHPPPPFPFWRRARERLRVEANRQRARRAGLPRSLTLEQWIDIIKKYDGRCAYCGIRPYEVLDHVIPIDRGGGTTADNCVPSCQLCNSIKGTNLLEDMGLSLRVPDWGE